MPILTIPLLETSVWTKADVIAAIVASSLFVLILVAQIWATWYTRRAANAAKDAAQEARASNERASEEADIRLRPWLSIGPPVIVRVTSPTGVLLSPLEANPAGVALNASWPDDSVVTLEFPFINYGEFPAHIRKVLRVSSFSEEEVENYLQENSQPDGDPAVFVPHATVEIPLDINMGNIKRIRAPNPERMFLGAVAIYEDRNQKLWIVKSVFEYFHLSTRTILQSLPEIFPKGDTVPIDVHAESEGNVDQVWRDRLPELLDLATLLFTLLFIAYSTAGLWLDLSRPNAIVALVAASIFGVLLSVNVFGRWKRKS